MRTLIAIILILSGVSCARAKNKSNNNDHRLTERGAYLACSINQVRKQCLDQSHFKRIPPRFFYYRQCYIDYNICVKGHGY